MTEKYACEKCKLITNMLKCPRCGGNATRDWQGYLIIIDSEKSEIAEKAKIESRGTYALRV
jgi:DNA-directed RNA polymerase subunit E"